MAHQITQNFTNKTAKVTQDEVHKLVDYVTAFDVAITGSPTVAMQVHSGLRSMVSWTWRLYRNAPTPTDKASIANSLHDFMVHEAGMRLLLHDKGSGKYIQISTSSGRAFICDALSNPLHSMMTNSPSSAPTFLSEDSINRWKRHLQDIVHSFSNPKTKIDVTAYVDYARDMDILSGNSSKVKLHKGNVILHALVGWTWRIYREASKKQFRVKLIRILYEFITGKAGMRFIRLDERNCRYYELSRTAAKCKLGQTFRDRFTAVDGSPGFAADDGLKFWGSQLTEIVQTGRMNSSVLKPSALWQKLVKKRHEEAEIYEDQLIRDNISSIREQSTQSLDEQDHLEIKNSSFIAESTPLEKYQHIGPEKQIVPRDNDFVVTRIANRGEQTSTTENFSVHQPPWWLPEFKENDDLGAPSPTASSLAQLGRHRISLISNPKPNRTLATSSLETAKVRLLETESLEGRSLSVQGPVEKTIKVSSITEPAPMTRTSLESAKAGFLDHPAGSPCTADRRDSTRHPPSLEEHARLSVLTTGAEPPERSKMKKGPAVLPLKQPWALLNGLPTQEPALASTQIVYVDHTTDLDIFTGRGGRKRYKGNRIYNALVGWTWRMFKEAPNVLSKVKVSRALLHFVTVLAGMRFLGYDKTNGRHFILSEKAAMCKMGHTFRDIRKAVNGSPGFFVADNYDSDYKCWISKLEEIVKMGLLCMDELRRAIPVALGRRTTPATIVGGPRSKSSTASCTPLQRSGRNLPWSRTPETSDCVMMEAGDEMLDSSQTKMDCSVRDMSSAPDGTMGVVDSRPAKKKALGGEPQEPRKGSEELQVPPSDPIGIRRMHPQPRQVSKADALAIFGALKRAVAAGRTSNAGNTTTLPIVAQWLDCIEQSR